MRRVVAGVLFMTTVCRAASDRNSEQYMRCIEKAANETAMHVCANEEALRADAELNDIYQKLLSAARKQPADVEKIRAVERAWIAYRDAFIEAMYPAKDKQAAYGSMFPMEVDLLRARLTREQTEALKAITRWRALHAWTGREAYPTGCR